MPRLKYAVPSYRKHKQSGQAIVTLNGKDYLLGPHGTAASRAKYDRLIQEWLDRGRQPAIDTEDGLSILELTGRYWIYALERYVRNGRPTAEQFHIKTACQHLLRLYENEPVNTFGPVQLKAVRQSMIDGGWARKYINQQVGVLVRMFKWGVTEALVPVSVHAAVDLVDGIRRGQTAARETQKIRGTDETRIQAILQHLSPTVRAMVELQHVTGMRPGEVCIMRPMDMDRSHPVWEYRPQDHKTAYHDQDRVVCIGPKGQAVLRPFLLRASDAYCFSPAESMDWHRQRRHEERKTPISCGNVPGSNRKQKPQRTPGAKFDAGSYRRAIHRACDIAFPAPEEDLGDAGLLAAWRKEHRWSPHQLRHSMATRIRREFDIEAAKAVLGHSATNVTGIYAEVDHRRAVEVAKRIG
jgi:integrase